MKANAGFLCLTKKAEAYYSQYAPAKFIPWCVDLDLFDGKPPAKPAKKPFFLANGKTYRDYKTLIEAANEIKVEIRIIGPSNQKPSYLPRNVNWINTSNDPPDKAIDYNTLREWYAQCIGVCIPLCDDADDTCGYTNMLETMAMRKPVLMTKSGCLHINPQNGNFGLSINPYDTKDWVRAMNSLLDNQEKRFNMGDTGRKIVERDFRIDHFNKEVINFIDRLN